VWSFLENVQFHGQTFIEKNNYDPLRWVFLDREVNIASLSIPHFIIDWHAAVKSTLLPIRIFSLLQHDETFDASQQIGYI